ncbi:hypothetical protein [uncultured Polaribacter sp.]|uniref:hypothetical protein n=1 Tax=uncultured Polaribacter sp. TaxID=174711 RepID=UPI0026254DCF|nr:hypothetical protein [uncultured Polaribacter sp.]
MKFFKKVSFLLSTILFFSCSQTLDFNQIEDYTTTPVFTSSLTLFTLNASNFVAFPGAPPVTEISERSDFKIFENSYVRDNLVRIDFDFEIRNEFNRDFTMEISLLDAANNLIYKLQDLNIEANNLEFIQKEIIDITQNPNLRNFTNVEVTLSLDDKITPISASDIGILDFKSAITVYLETTL